MTERILVVEDDPQQLKLLLALLQSAGYGTEGYTSAGEALAQYKKNPFSLVITDFKMKDMSGIDLLCEIKRLNAEALVICMTGFGTIDVAVSAMKKGAFDFLTKPYTTEVLLYSVRRAFRVKLLEEETIRLHMELMDRFCFENIIGGSPQMKELFKQISRASLSDLPCLIEGENGSGKELIARAMHYEGVRRNKPFVTARCARVSQSLFDVEFFGLEKGALEDHSSSHIGKIEQAEGGTLFVDEIREMESPLQDKLLDFIRSKKYQRVGSHKSTPANVRIIASSTHPLGDLVKRKEFNKELSAQLHRMHLHVPPLRQRKEDISLLVRHFFTQYGLSQIHVDREVVEAFEHYDWPGNVQELKNYIERLIILSPRVKTFHLKDIPPDIRMILNVPIEQNTS